MKAVIAEAAEQELAEAVTYYNEQAPGLGARFLDDFQAAVTRIETFPEAWHAISANTRRCRLQRFPYGLIYRATPDSTVIIAVAHLHREPHYWCDRI